MGEYVSVLWQCLCCVYVESVLCLGCVYAVSVLCLCYVCAVSVLCLCCVFDVSMVFGCFLVSVHLLNIPPLDYKRSSKTHTLVTSYYKRRRRLTTRKFGEEEMGNGKETEGGHVAEENNGNAPWGRG